VNTVPDNGHTKANIAEQRRAAYQAAQQPATAAQRPTARPTLGKARQWLLAAALGLLVGGAAVGYVAYQTMPIAATEVQRVFADVNGDGVPDLIVSGWVIYAPKAGGQ